MELITIILVSIGVSIIVSWSMMQLQMKMFEKWIDTFFAEQVKLNKKQVDEFYEKEDEFVKKRIRDYHINIL